MSDGKMIDRATYFSALGLFTVASKHMLMAKAAEGFLEELLGLESGASHLSDEIYSPGSHNGFDEALKRAGFVVEPLPAPPAKGE